MSGFQIPSGLREITVDDPSLERFKEPSVEEKEAAFKEARIAKQQGQRIAAGPKRRIELLLGMFRATREVTIRNTIIVLQSLKNKEVKEATHFSMGKTYEVEVSQEVRTQLLARSIVSVDGISLEDLLQTNDVKDKVSFVDEMDELFILKLWKEYQAMTKEIEVEFGLAKPDVAQEIVGDLKK